MFSESSFLKFILSFNIDAKDNVKLNNSCSISKDNYFRQCNGTNLVLVCSVLSIKTWISENVCSWQHRIKDAMYSKGSCKKQNQKRN